jgi:hypothetical protein
MAEQFMQPRPKKEHVKTKPSLPLEEDKQAELQLGSGGWNKLQQEIVIAITNQRDNTQQGIALSTLHDLEDDYRLETEWKPKGSNSSTDIQILLQCEKPSRT